MSPPAALPTTSPITAIDASVKAAHHKASLSSADALVFFMRPDGVLPTWFEAEEPAVFAQLERLIEHGEISGKKDNVVVLHALERPFHRVVTVGLGDKTDLLSMMNAFATMARDLREKRILTFSVVVPDYLFPDESPAAIARLLAGAGTISCYTYHHFMQGEAPTHSFHSEFITRTQDEVEAVGRSAARGVDLGRSVVYSRDLCNLPGNYATPGYIAEQARALAQSSGGLLKATILGPDEMKAEGMNLLLAVAQGSHNPPHLACLDYEGDPGSKDRIAIVGKTVTFDAGGISIKSADRMMEMKRDKMGGTNTLGLAACVAAWKPKLNISFVVPAAENMPDGGAYRPGDCYQGMNGRWVEIISTDAEGRLVLADALTWVQKHRQPKVVVDMATLTGGASRALGGAIIAGFANDQGLWERLERSALSSQETIWRLPLFDPYKKGVRSYFADTKNSSTTPPSTIKAALFLQEWIDPGVRWAHLDVAASMSQNRPSGILSRGATGMGLVLIADLLEIFEADGF